MMTWEHSNAFEMVVSTAFIKTLQLNGDRIHSINLPKVAVVDWACN